MSLCVAAIPPCNAAVLEINYNKLPKNNHEVERRGRYTVHMVKDKLHVFLFKSDKS